MKLRKIENNGNNDDYTLSVEGMMYIVIHSHLKLEHVEVIAFDANTNTEHSVSSVLSRAIEDGLALQHWSLYRLLRKMWAFKKIKTPVMTLDHPNHHRCRSFFQHSNSHLRVRELVAYCMSLLSF